MIIRDENTYKGTMLRGFNNTPSNIRDQINKANMVAKKYEETKKEVAQKDISKGFDPSKQKDIIQKMNRINK